MRGNNRLLKELIPSLSSFPDFPKPLHSRVASLQRRKQQPKKFKKKNKTKQTTPALWLGLKLRTLSRRASGSSSRKPWLDPYLQLSGIILPAADQSLIPSPVSKGTLPRTAEEPEGLDEFFGNYGRVWVGTSFSVGQGGHILPGDTRDSFAVTLARNSFQEAPSIPEPQAGSWGGRKFLPAAVLPLS